MAQELPRPIRMAAACSPVSWAAPSDAPLIVGGMDPSPKAMYGPRELVVINVGTASEIQAGQQYFTRRAMQSVGADPIGMQDTTGWITIVAVTDQNAIALIEFSCGGIAIGDHLEPYAEPVLPPGIDRTDTSGELDFSVLAHVIHGDDGRSAGAVGDFMIADIGQNQGIAPGARFGIFRDVYRSDEVPLVTIGEAVVVSTTADNSLVRLTQTRDAIVAGDLLVARKPKPAAAAPPSPPVPVASGEGDESPSLAVPEAPAAGPLAGDYTFEDVHFDFDRFTLRPDALPILEEVVTALQRDPALRLHIEGHSCNIGTAEYNLALGARRAEAVRDHLVARGISATRLTTVSYGEERPKHDNSEEETRRQNRRAALVVNLQR
jgi:peptidoglycan-associated lipoprotein